MIVNHTHVTGKDPPTVGTKLMDMNAYVSKDGKERIVLRVSRSFILSCSIVPYQHTGILQKMM